MEEQQQKPKFKFSWIIILALLVVMAIVMFSNNGYQGEYLHGGESQIQQLIDGTHKNKDGEQEQIVAYYTDGSAIYFLLEESDYKDAFPDYADYYYIVRTSEQLDRICTSIDAHNLKPGVVFIEDTGVAVAGTNIWDIIYPILYIGFGVFMIWMIFRLLGSSNKGAMNFGKSKARAYTNSKVRFSDIAGTEEEKEELREIVEFLRDPKKFTELGARIPKGVLLVGQPGTGKTLLARAVAGEANVKFISISGSDFVEMFVGVGASRVRDLFDQAKKNKPCIVFIDEIDAVGRQRGAGLGGGNDEREQTLNQLLVEMDGFEQNDGIIVLAATNRSDVLDPALMRPGRFDRQIYVNVPDVKGREGILRIHARNKPLDENVDFETLAKITVGFTGADLENMLNEAAILAARENRPKITMVDITEGINKVTMGPQKKSRLVTEKDKKITAYHEAGHAVLATKLKHTDSVQEVSIIPRGMAGGYTMQRPENDNSYASYNFLMDEIAVCMGGRIAEQLIFKDITTGASADINQATKIARKMVYNYGMSKNLGFLSLDSSGQVFIGRDYQTKNDFSEKLASEADDEVRQILDYNYSRATKVLKENMALLEEMTKLLLDQETINKAEIDMLLEGKSAEEIASVMREQAAIRKEKEAATKKAQEEERKKKMLEDKIREGEKLVMAGIISQEEFAAIKARYEQDMPEQQEAEKTPKLSTGVSLAAEENASTSAEAKTEETAEETPKAEAAEEKPVKPKAPRKTTKKTTTEEEGEDK